MKSFYRRAGLGGTLCCHEENKLPLIGVRCWKLGKREQAWPLLRTSPSLGTRTPWRAERASSGWDAACRLAFEISEAFSSRQPWLDAGGKFRGLCVGKWRFKGWDNCRNEWEDTEHVKVGGAATEEGELGLARDWRLIGENQIALQ